MNITTESNFRAACVLAISHYYNKELMIPLNVDDVFIVWQCKTLQNFKAMASTNISDGRYFEITYNGDKKELYLDAYVKEKNTCIKELVPWETES